jgi:hypothetical protein
MSTSTAATRSVPVPSGRVLVGTVYAVCVLGLIGVFVGEILFTDNDPYRSEGPVESITGVGVVGTVALAIGVGLTLVIFWSGAPGLFGACAAWLAGLTRGGRPLGGAARVAGIVGAFIALLNIVLTVGGVLSAGVTGWDS